MFFSKVMSLAYIHRIIQSNITINEHRLEMIKIILCIYNIKYDAFKALSPMEAYNLYPHYNDKIQIPTLSDLHALIRSQHLGDFEHITLMRILSRLKIDFEEFKRLTPDEAANKYPGYLQTVHPIKPYLENITLREVDDAIERYPDIAFVAASLGLRVEDLNERLNQLGTSYDSRKYQLAEDPVLFLQRHYSPPH